MGRRLDESAGVIVRVIVDDLLFGNIADYI